MRSPPCPAGAAGGARVAPRGGVGRWRAPIDRGVSLIAETASDESPGPPNASSADRNRSASSERSSRWRSMTARSSSTLTSTRAYPAAPTTRPSSFARGLSRGSRCRASAAALPRKGDSDGVLSLNARRRRTGRARAPHVLRHAYCSLCVSPPARGALPVATPQGPRVSRDDHGRRPPRPPGD